MSAFGWGCARIHEWGLDGWPLLAANPTETGDGGGPDCD